MPQEGGLQSGCRAELSIQLRGGVNKLLRRDVRAEHYREERALPMGRDPQKGLKVCFPVPPPSTRLAAQSPWPQIATPPLAPTVAPPPTALVPPLVPPLGPLPGARRAHWGRF